MTATRDFLETTSHKLNQAVLRAKEAVTDEKLLRISTRCQQGLEDAWIKHNAAHALYASKLKEPALKAEAQAIWLGEMRRYEAALDSLEEYLENLQVEPGNAQGDTAVDEDVDVDEDDCDTASKLGFEAIGDEYVEAEGGTVKTAVQKKDEKESKQLQKLKEEKGKESKGGKPQAQEEKKPEAVKEARPENEDEVEGEEEKNMRKSKQENDDKEEEIVAEVEVEQIGAKDVRGAR